MTHIIAFGDFVLRHHTRIAAQTQEFALLTAIQPYFETILSQFVLARTQMWTATVLRENGETLEDFLFVIDFAVVMRQHFFVIFDCQLKTVFTAFKVKTERKRLKDIDFLNHQDQESYSFHIPIVHIDDFMEILQIRFVIRIVGLKAVIVGIRNEYFVQ